MNTTQIVKELLSSEKIPGAILIEGDWGSGKTYYWHHTVCPQLKMQTVVYVSLFGSQSIEQIKANLISKLILNIGTKKIFDDKLNSFTKLIANTGKELAGAAGKIAEKAIGVNPVEVFNKLIPNVDPLEFLPQNCIVCFDDLERAPSDLLEDILGLISFLIEERNSKVVVLVNETKLNEKLKKIEYVEKVFWKTIAFNCSLDEVFNISLGKYSSNKSKKDILKFKAEILDLFMNVDHSNIRTLNKAIRWISELYDQGIKINVHYIKYLICLLIHKAEYGRLLPDPEVYAFSTGYMIADLVRKTKNSTSKKELTESQKESLVFYKRFGVKYHITSSKQLHQLIFSNVLIKKKLLTELIPESKKSQAVKVCELLNSKSWMFKDESSLLALRKKALKILVTSQNLNLQIALNILKGISNIDQVLEINSSDADETFQNLIKKSKYQKLIFSDVMLDMCNENERKKMIPLIDQIKEDQRKKMIQKTRKEFIRNITNDQRGYLYSNEFRYNEDLLKAVICDETINTKMRDVFFKNPNLFYDYYMIIPGFIKIFPWGPEYLILFQENLKEIYKIPTLDKVERYRLDFILNAHKSDEKVA